MSVGGSQLGFAKNKQTSKESLQRDRDRSKSGYLAPLNFCCFPKGVEFSGKICKTRGANGRILIKTGVAIGFTQFFVIDILMFIECVEYAKSEEQLLALSVASGYALV